MRFKKSSSALLALFLSVFMMVGIPASQAALTVGTNTGNYYSSTGGGSLGTAACGGTSVLIGAGAQTYNYDSGTYKATLTQLTGTCATMSADGQTVGTVSTGVGGPFGSTSGSALTAPSCSASGGNQVVVGAKIYKTSPGGYTGGITLLCGTLPLGTNRTYGNSLGDTTSGTSQDIACAAGSVATGLYVYYGGILDKFGISCAALLTIPQTISISSLGTSSANYPYSQALSMTTSGNNGTGAITFAVANGTATSCALSSSANNATITAGSSGTCTITATIAADTNYVSATSAAATFTFNQSGQASLTVTSTSGVFGTDLTLTTSGGSGTGNVSYSYAAGTTTCTLSLSVLSATSSGTCLITATKAADTNYSSISSSQTTVTFSQGVSTTTLTIPGGSIIYRQAKALTVVTNAAGKVTFKANKVVIPGCKNLVVNSGNSLTAICNYKAAIHGAVTISATFTPSNAGYIPSSTVSPIYYTSPRTGKR